MTDRRSGPPLFDLMRERGENPDAPNPSASPPMAPVPKQAPKPVVPGAGTHDGPEVSPQQTAWDTSGGVSRAERSAAAMLDEDVHTDTGVRLSSPMFYSMIVVALVLIVAAWTIGHQRGFQAGKDEMSRHVQDQPVVRPALQSPEAVVPQLPADTGLGEPEPVAQQIPGTTPTPTGLGIMSSAGFLDLDPREPGLNYLALAVLSAEQTADAISFMYSQGVEVIGVPMVDSGASGANNPSRYTLYSLGVAIPGNQWSAMSSARHQHQTLISRLGARWQREHRGGSDFSQTNWEKYDP